MIFNCIVKLRTTRLTTSFPGYFGVNLTSRYGINFKRNWKGGEGSVKISESTQASTNLTVFFKCSFNVDNHTAQRP